MTRGQGLEIKKRYRWCQQPNNRLCIFDVPIFATFSDEHKGTVDKAGLVKIVAQFTTDKVSGFYPRVHLKHQDNGTENAPGVGFLDNLYIDGNIIYGDLVEILPEYAKMLTGSGPSRLPGRSVEYLPEESRIEGLALLESRSPFFRFPILALEKDPLESKALQQFEKRRGKKLAFFKKKNITFQDQDSDPNDINNDPASESEAEEQNFCNMQGEGGMEAKMEQLLSVMTQLLEAVNGEDEGEPEDDGIGEELEEDEENVVSSEKPSSVAMQANPALRVLDGQLKQILKFQGCISKRLEGLEGKQAGVSYTEKLRAICCTSETLDFNGLSSHLDKFSTTKDKDNFLIFVEAQAEQYGSHPAMNMLSGVDRQKIAGKKNKMVQKYHDAQHKTQMIAGRAAQDYAETIGQSNRGKGEKFQSIWPDMEKFVDFWVNEEEVSPGAYEKFSKGG